MKKILTLLVAALSLASFSNKATAQKDTSIYKTWNDLLLKIKKDKKAGTTNHFKEADPKLNATRDQWTAAINKSISAKPATEPFFKKFLLFMV